MHNIAAYLLAIAAWEGYKADLDLKWIDLYYPTHQVCLDNYTIANQHWVWISGNPSGWLGAAEVKYQRYGYLGEQYIHWQQEAKLCAIVWLRVYEVKNINRGSSRIGSIKELKKLVGEYNFYNVNLPPPVPIWRFIYVD